MPPSEDFPDSLPPFVPAGDACALDLRTGRLTPQERMLAVETPVNIVYAPIPFAVMMTTRTVGSK